MARDRPVYRGARLFFNDTTDYADYILPATTFLEHTDIQGAYGHYFVQLSNQAIEPPGRSALECVALQSTRPAHGIHRSHVSAIRRRADVPPGARDWRGRSLDKSRTWSTSRFEDLEEQGHIPLGFHRDPESSRFMPVYFRRVAHALRQDRILFRNAGRAGTGSASRLHSYHRNRAGAEARSAFRWSFWAAKRTTT